MAELKTKKSAASVEDFLNTTTDESKRRDAFVILEMMGQISGSEPRMWGTSIVGFGDRHYHYASGREGDWFVVGFSPRKENLTLYLTFGGIEDIELVKKLGKYKAGKGCLYIKRLQDVNLDVLKELISLTVSMNSG
jgi:hypothetical protein